jgi:DNA-binding beta-propeller fold protein YncE
VLALVAVLLASPPGPAVADLIYVLNSGEANVTVIDSITRTEFRRLPMLREPHHLLMMPNGRDLIIADSAANEIVIINPDTAEVIRRERISNPYHLGYSPDGKYFVINSLRRGQVDIYDAASMTLLSRLTTPTQPSHMAFSPDSKRVFVTLQGTRGLLAIDLDERRALWQVDVGPQPAGVIWHNNRLLVGIMGGDYVTVVDPAEARIERQITTARGSHTVWPAPDGKTIYATSRVDSAITLLDGATLEVKGRWDLPGGPDDMSVAPDGKLWVTLRWSARIAIIDPATGQYETMRVGRSPHGIMVHPTPPAQPIAAADPAAPAASRPAEPPRPEPRSETPAVTAPGSATLLLPSSLLSSAYAAEAPVPPVPESPLVASQPHRLAPYNPMSGRLTLR